MKGWHRLSNEEKKSWDDLCDYLVAFGKIICNDNHCNEDKHNCSSNAYITANAELLEICEPDYFQGSATNHAVIVMPIDDDYTGKKLYKDVCDYYGIDRIDDAMADAMEMAKNQFYKDGYSIEINNNIPYISIKKDGETLHFMQGEIASDDLEDVPCNVSENAYLFHKYITCG